MNEITLKKRNPVQTLKMAMSTACAMGTAAMMSTVFAYADVTSAINKVFNVGNSVANAISKGLSRYRRSYRYRSLPVLPGSYAAEQRPQRRPDV